MANKYELRTFRQEVKTLLDRIYEEEGGTVIPIHIDNMEIQGLIEEYDEDFPTVLINIAQEEIDNFLNYKIDDTY